MADRFEALVFAVEKAEGIVQFFPVVQFSPGQHEFDEFVPAHFLVIEILVPLEEVLDRGQEVAVTDGVEIFQELPVLFDFLWLSIFCTFVVGLFFRSLRLILKGTVADDPVFYDERPVVVEVAVGHIQRSEDILGGEFAEGLAARPLHQLRQEDIS